MNRSKNEPSGIPHSVFSPTACHSCGIDIGSIIGLQFHKKHCVLTSEHQDSGSDSISCDDSPVATDAGNVSRSSTPASLDCTAYQTPRPLSPEILEHGGDVSVEEPCFFHINDIGDDALGIFGGGEDDYDVGGADGDGVIAGVNHDGSGADRHVNLEHLHLRNYSDVNRCEGDGWEVSSSGAHDVGGGHQDYDIIVCGGDSVTDGDNVGGVDDNIDIAGDSNETGQDDFLCESTTYYEKEDNDHSCHLAVANDRQKECEVVDSRTCTSDGLCTDFLQADDSEHQIQTVEPLLSAADLPRPSDVEENEHEKKLLNISVKKDRNYRGRRKSYMCPDCGKKCYSDQSLADHLSSCSIHYLQKISDYKMSGEINKDSTKRKDETASHNKSENAVEKEKNLSATKSIVPKLYLCTACMTSCSTMSALKVHRQICCSPKGIDQIVSDPYIFTDTEETWAVEKDASLSQSSKKKNVKHVRKAKRRNSSSSKSKECLFGKHLYTQAVKSGPEIVENKQSVSSDASVSADTISFSSQKALVLKYGNECQRVEINSGKTLALEDNSNMSPLPVLCSFNDKNVSSQVGEDITTTESSRRHVEHCEDVHCMSTDELTSDVDTSCKLLEETRIGIVSDGGVDTCCKIQHEGSLSESSNEGDFSIVQSSKQDEEEEHVSPCEQKQTTNQSHENKILCNSDDGMVHLEPLMDLGHTRQDCLSVVNENSEEPISSSMRLNAVVLGKMGERYDGLHQTETGSNLPIENEVESNIFVDIDSDKNTSKESFIVEKDNQQQLLNKHEIKCESCLKLFKTNFALKRHTLSSSCDIPIPSRFDCKKPSPEKTDTIEYKCTRCWHNFPSKEGLQRHVDSRESKCRASRKISKSFGKQLGSDENYCSDCDETLPPSVNLKLHKRQKHSLAMRMRSLSYAHNKKWYTFAKKAAMRQNRVKLCSVCWRGFYDEDKRQRHMRTHTKEELLSVLGLLGNKELSSARSTNSDVGSDGDEGASLSPHSRSQDLTTQDDTVDSGPGEIESDNGSDKDCDEKQSDQLIAEEHSSSEHLADHPIKKISEGRVLAGSHSTEGGQIEASTSPVIVHPESSIAADSNVQDICNYDTNASSTLTNERSSVNSLVGPSSPSTKTSCDKDETGHISDEVILVDESYKDPITQGLCKFTISSTSSVIVKNTKGSGEIIKVNIKKVEQTAAQEPSPSSESVAKSLTTQLPINEALPTLFQKSSLFYGVTQYINGHGETIPRYMLGFELIHDPVCYVCVKRFTSVNVLCAHMTYHHHPLKDDSLSNGYRHCKTCGVRVKNTNHAVIHYLKAHSNCDVHAKESALFATDSWYCVLCKYRHDWISDCYLHYLRAHTVILGSRNGRIVNVKCTPCATYVHTEFIEQHFLQCHLQVDKSRGVTLLKDVKSIFWMSESQGINKTEQFVELERKIVYLNVSMDARRVSCRSFTALCDCSKLESSCQKMLAHAQNHVKVEGSLPVCVCQLCKVSSVKGYFHMVKHVLKIHMHLGHNLPLQCGVRVPIEQQFPISGVALQYVCTCESVSYSNIVAYETHLKLSNHEDNAMLRICGGNLSVSAKVVSFGVSYQIKCKGCLFESDKVSELVNHYELSHTSVITQDRTFYTMCNMCMKIVKKKPITSFSLLQQLSTSEYECALHLLHDKNTIIKSSALPAPAENCSNLYMCRQCDAIALEIKDLFIHMLNHCECLWGIVVLEIANLEKQHIFSQKLMLLPPQDVFYKQMMMNKVVAINTNIASTSNAPSKIYPPITKIASPTTSTNKQPSVISHVPTSPSNMGSASSKLPGPKDKSSSMMPSIPVVSVGTSLGSPVLLAMRQFLSSSQAKTATSLLKPLSNSQSVLSRPPMLQSVLRPSSTVSMATIAPLSTAVTTTKALSSNVGVGRQAQPSSKTQPSCHRARVNDSKERLVQCFMCLRFFDNFMSLVNHLLALHDTDMNIMQKRRDDHSYVPNVMLMACPYCGVSEANLDNFPIHLAGHITCYRCIECQVILNDLMELQSHILLEHGCAVWATHVERNTKQRAPNLRTCFECGHKATYEQFSLHKRSHCKARSLGPSLQYHYTCSECRLTVTSASQFQLHLIDEHHKMPLSYNIKYMDSYMPNETAGVVVKEWTDVPVQPYQKSSQDSTHDIPNNDYSVQPRIIGKSLTKGTPIQMQQANGKSVDAEIHSLLQEILTDLKEDGKLENATVPFQSNIAKPTMPDNGNQALSSTKSRSVLLDNKRSSKPPRKSSLVARKTKFTSIKQKMSTEDQSSSASAMHTLYCDEILEETEDNVSLVQPETNCTTDDISLSLGEVQNMSTSYKTQYTCMFCSCPSIMVFACTSPQELLQHIQETHLDIEQGAGQKHLKVSCCMEDCKYTSIGVKSYVMHMKHTHKIKVQQKKETTTTDDFSMFQCGICTDKLLPSTSDLIEHVVQIHLQNRKRNGICPVALCGMVYSSVSELAKHFGSNHASKRVRLHCELCDHKMCSQTEVKRHASECPRRFQTDKSTMEQCMLCDNEVKRENLSQHLADVHKIYDCIFCKKKFGRSTLAVHITRHHCMQFITLNQHRFSPQGNCEINSEEISDSEVSETSEMMSPKQKQILPRIKRGRPSKKQKREDIEARKHQLSLSQILKQKIYKSGQLSPKIMTTNKELSTSDQDNLHSSDSDLRDITDGSSKRLPTLNTGSVSCNKSHTIFPSEDVPALIEQVHCTMLQNCKYCHFQTVNSEEFESHMSELHPSCHICGAGSFPNQPSLDSHLNRIHGQRFGCSECGQRFTKQREWKVHYNNHLVSRPLICPLDNDRFGEYSEIEAHMATHEDLNTKILSFSESTCYICSLAYSHKPKYLRHIQIHVDKSEKRICQICSVRTTFKDVLSWNEHVKSVHRNECTVKLAYTCGFCYSDLSSVADLFDHIMSVHRSGKPYMCIVCDIKLSLFTSMDKHGIKKHSNRKVLAVDKPYRCSICWIDFEDTAKLESHIRGHTLYPCEKCHQVYLSQSEINDHCCRYCVTCGKIIYDEISMQQHTTQFHSTKVNGDSLHAKSIEHGYKCLKCHFVTDDIEIWFKHLLGDHAQSNEPSCSVFNKNVEAGRMPDYVCPHCSCIYHSQIHYGEHIYTRHMKDLGRCALCDPPKDFHHEHQLIVHKFLEHEQSRCCCEPCVKVMNDNINLLFRSYKLLVNEEEKENVIKMIPELEMLEIVLAKAWICASETNPCESRKTRSGKCSLSRTSLRKNSKRQEMGKQAYEKMLKCELCDDDFPNHLVLDAHVTYKHSQYEKCVHCRNLYQIEQMQRHIMTSHAVCAICGNMIGSDTDLRKHLITQHQEICVVCGKVFSKPDEMLHHVKSYHSTISIVCNHCNRRLTGASSGYYHLLNEHQASIQCVWCGVKYDGSDYDGIQCHLSYTCPKKGKDSQEWICKCSMCTAQCCSYPAYIRHLMSEHLKSNDNLSIYAQFSSGNEDVGGKSLFSYSGSTQNSEHEPSLLEMSGESNTVGDTGNGSGLNGCLSLLAGFIQKDMSDLFQNSGAIKRKLEEAEDVMSKQGRWSQPSTIEEYQALAYMNLAVSSSTSSTMNDMMNELDITIKSEPVDSG